MQTFVRFQEGRVRITLYTGVVYETSANTAQRLGLTSSCTITGLHADTFTALLNCVRNGSTPAPRYIAHAMAVGMWDADPNADCVALARLNVGGWHFMVDKQKLIDTFTYFETMFNGSFAESTSDTIFIDRDPVPFCEILDHLDHLDQCRGDRFRQELDFYLIKHPVVEPAPPTKEAVAATVEAVEVTPNAQAFADAYNAIRPTLPLTTDALWTSVGSQLKTFYSCVVKGTNTNKFWYFDFPSTPSPEQATILLSRLSGQGFRARMLFNRLRIDFD